MSPAREDTPFAGDGTLWTDGEAPYRDSLAGDFSNGAHSDFSDTLFQPAATPPQTHPDSHSVREMMNAVLLDEEDAMPEEDDYSTDFKSSKSRGIDPSQPPLGMLPQQQSWPARKVLKPRKSGATRKKKLREQLRQRPSGLIPRKKLSTGTVGVIIAAVLMIIFGIVAIAMLSSLFSMIGSVFQN